MYIIYLIFDKFPTINCLWCQKDSETPVIYGNHQIAKLKLIYIYVNWRCGTLPGHNANNGY